MLAPARALKFVAVLRYASQPAQMKYFLALLLASAVLAGFAKQEGISTCCLSFEGIKSFRAMEPDRLPERADNSRTINTESGAVSISRLDGYRILYSNKKGEAFVNLKIELSDPAKYQVDKQHLLESLQYQIAHSRDMATPAPVELQSNGYKLYGYDRSKLDAGTTMGLYTLFLANNTVVYFYFNNMESGARPFESVGEYRALRTRFIDEYTNHLRSCH